MSTEQQNAEMRSAADEISDICRRTFQRPGPDGTVPRAFHRKSHALLQANLTIHNDLPREIAHGLFAAPGTYEAWVRFSSSFFEADRVPDARGMAIKLLDVPGETCRPETAGEQDLVMLNQSTAIFADEAAALDYFRIMDGCRQITPFNIAPPQFVIPGFNPARLRWRFIGTLLDVVKQTIRCPDLTRLSYYSGTPYRLGDGAMKFGFRPSAGPKTRLSGSLRNRLRQQLAVGPVRFEFMVQRRTRPDKEPLDDASRSWTSPFAVVGEMEIPSQEFETDERAILDREISFMPWNCLKDHEPLGSVNRIRRTAYADAAINRLAACPFTARPSTS